MIISEDPRSSASLRCGSMVIRRDPWSLVRITGVGSAANIKMMRRELFKYTNIDQNNNAHLLVGAGKKAHCPGMLWENLTNTMQMLDGRFGAA